MPVAQRDGHQPDRAVQRLPAPQGRRRGRQVHEDDHGLQVQREAPVEPNPVRGQRDGEERPQGRQLHLHREHGPSDSPLSTVVGLVAG